MTKHKYDDIIDLPRPVSARHARMPLRERAAQFSPFAALTGYGAVIDETARLTDKRIVLDEHRKAELDEQLRLIADAQPARPAVRVTCFVPDARKDGGAYVTLTGAVKKIDAVARTLVLADGRSIAIEDITALECL